MRIALCFKGGVGMRSGKQYRIIREISQEESYVDFERSLDSLGRSLVKLFPNSEIDTFLHCWNLDLKERIVTALIARDFSLKWATFQSNNSASRRLSLNVKKARAVRLKKIENNFLFRCFKIVVSKFFSTKKSREFSVYSQWYSQSEVLSLALDCGLFEGINYDIFVVTRLDAFFNVEFIKKLNERADISTIRVKDSLIECKKEISCEHGDIFIICNKKGAETLSRMYIEFENEGEWPRPHLSFHSVRSIATEEVTLNNLELSTGLEIEIMRKIETQEKLHLVRERPVKEMNFTKTLNIVWLFSKTLKSKIRKQIYDYLFLGQ